MNALETILNFFLALLALSILVGIVVFVCFIGTVLGGLALAAAALAITYALVADLYREWKRRRKNNKQAAS